MQSMTGFGSASYESGGIHLAARIRSVNHRNLDLVVRLPEELRPLELQLRERIAARLSRGRVEVRVDLEDQRDRPVRVHVNRQWVEALQRTTEALTEAQLDLDRLSLGDLLRIPDAVQIRTESGDGDEQIAAALTKVFDAALDDLVSSRASEGGRLRGILEDQIESLDGLVRKIGEGREVVFQDQQTRLRSRVEELVQGVEGLEPGRIEQEIAILAERSDVREELDRLASHLQQFRETVAQVGAIGKKLDFIAQEIGRELATLGAKYRQAGVTPHQVEARLICEQLREQIQNIE